MPIGFPREELHAIQTGLESIKLVLQNYVEVSNVDSSEVRCREERVECASCFLAYRLE